MGVAMTTTTPAGAAAPVPADGAAIVTPCAHRDFAAAVSVHAGVGGGQPVFAASLSIHCRQCGRAMLFAGGQPVATLPLVPAP